MIRDILIFRQRANLFEDFDTFLFKMAQNQVTLRVRTINNQTDQLDENNFLQFRSFRKTIKIHALLN